MTILNWHKRNPGAVARKPATCFVSNDPKAETVQIRVTDWQGRHLNLDMGVAEARDIRAQLDHCLARFCSSNINNNPVHTGENT
jgi:hypothetical protein